MHTTLDSMQLKQVREALLHEQHSEALIDLIFHLNLSLPLTEAARFALDTAQQLGWVTKDPSPRLTSTGWLVADPLREYRLWLDRDRRIHGELEHDLLVPERYADKKVLEVGSGFGCNLLSLARRVPGNFVGVEPMAIYRQFTPILAEREGMNAPEVHAGSGEQLPVADESFDIVLCYSAHQYMDIRKAIKEKARVLRPGGQLQIVGNTLNVYGPASLRSLLKRPSPSATLSVTRTIVNTVGYQWLGRRVWPSLSQFATASPIYPTKNAMCHWMSQAGLTVRPDLIKRVGEETCFVADKPHRPATQAGALH